MIHLALEVASFLFLAFVALVVGGTVLGLLIVLFQAPGRIREWQRNRK